MRENKVFQIALLVSLGLHGIILVFNPGFFTLSDLRKQPQKITEVRYIEQARQTNLPKPAMRSLEPFLKNTPRMISEKSQAMPSINKEELFRSSAASTIKKSDFAQPNIFKPDILEIRKKITLSSPTNLEKLNSPAYVEHSQIVREKIRRLLYQNYNSVEVGQTYLTFVLLKDGALKDVRVVPEKSSSTPYLDQIALQSVRSAAPYPPFPKDLDYEMLSFNVIVSFEVE